MSHFLTAVISRSGSEEETRNLLAPFDEGIEVDPYEKRCWCVGSKARADVLAELAKTIGVYENLDEAFWNSHRGKMEEDPLWACSTEALLEHHKWMSEFDQAKEQALLQHPLRNVPEAGCSQCHGSGVYVTTQNPRSKWDCWEIGGQFNGEITGRRIRPDVVRIEDNRVPVPIMLELEIIPFALITPDGEWHERGSMRWFGPPLNLRDDWPDEVRKILSQHRECIAVGVDCHI